MDPDAAVIDAAESCPVEAVLVRSADGAVLAPQPWRTRAPQRRR
ncbi:hypothetical protein ACQPYE_07200 [Actinosynnema sp. CA-299493]